MSVSKAEWKVIEQEVEVKAEAILTIDEVKNSKKIVVVIITDDDDKAFEKAIAELKVSNFDKLEFIRIKSKQKAPYKAMVFRKGKQVGRTISLNAQGLKKFAGTLKQFAK